MSLSQTVDQTKVPWGRNTEHFYVLAAFCYNLKFLYGFKNYKYDINQSTYQYRNSTVYTKMYLMVCRSSIYFFSCMLNTLIFTVDRYILKKKKTINVPLGLSQLQSSVLLINTISIHHIVKCFLSYYIIQQFQKKLFCLLTKQVWVKVTWAIRIDLKAYYLLGNINYKAISC